MKSLAKQSSILILCRLLNYVILFVTPVALVRILSVETFGQYKEFMLYAGMIVNFAGFSVNKSLLYFVSKYIDNKKFVSNTIFINFLITFFVLLLLFIFKRLIIKNVSYDFIFPLGLYLILFLNFDFCETYWIAVKKTYYVLYYNTFRVVLRGIAIILVASLFSDIILMIYSLVIIECVRFCFVVIYSIRNNFFSFEFDFSGLKEQLKYITPMGFSNFLLYFNKELSKFFILYSLGIEYLAFYSIGAYQIPIVGIVRGSIGDVIFSEVCGRCEKSKNNALELWKKTNVLYLAIIFPVFIVFYYFAENFIVVCFTDKYLKSIVVFKIYMFLMLKECFETGILIRSLNKNRFYVYGYSIAFCLNVILLVLFRDFFVFSGPAIAYVISDSFVYIFFGIKVLSLYEIRLSNLFYWKKFFLIVFLGLAILPVLFFEKFFDANLVVKTISFSFMYMVIYFCIIVNLNIYEINIVYIKLKKFCINEKIV